MMDWNLIRMGRNDRGVLIGATGSGKTYLGRFLVEDSAKPYSVVYDAKISDSISKWKRHEFVTSLEELQESDAKRIVYRPDFFAAADAVQQDRFFEWVYLRQFTRVFVDEAYAIAGGTNPLSYFQAVLTRGRERGISALVGTQRPARIPLVVFTESQHFYCFQLMGPTDRKRIEEISGGLISEADQISLNEHEFFYFNALRGIYVGDGKFSRVGGSPQKLKVFYRE